ncbi:LysE family transporter [Bengtsoniella intestinalis]|uniref:LysE family transporter n=1 Tax=Bengtsoniella intestinalis TaxID=3073143 RepID=UPI00391F17B3
MDWIHFLTYVLATTITPGPNTITSMSNASRVGFRKGISLNFGMWFGFSIVSLCCAAFCSLLTTALPVMQWPLLILGAVYMLHLAWKMWKTGGITANDSGKSGFTAGALLQFVNVKIYIYCMVSMQAYILPIYSDQPLIVAGFALFLAFAGFVCGLVWAAGGSALKVLFSRYAVMTNRVLALALVYCAVALFI